MIEHVNIPEERLVKLKGDRNWSKPLKRFLDFETIVRDDVMIEGDNSLHVIKVKEIVKAFGRGFTIEEAMDLLDDDYFLEIIEVKDYAGKSKNRQTVMKGRLIGERGVIKKLIERCADVKLSVYGKTVSIIGKYSNIKIARDAVEMILSGSKHNTVYRFLQENKVV